jgi:hypothetical protein
MIYAIYLFTSTSSLHVGSSFPLLGRRPARASTITWLRYPDYGGQDPSTSNVERSQNITFHDFLLRHFDQKRVTPFVSLVDKNYAKEGLNFQLKLQEFGMDNPVVLICAEEGCLDYAEKRGMFAYGGYMLQGRGQFGDAALESRAGLLPWIKFTGLLELAMEGWNNVWIEGDTYLNG